MKPCQHSHRRSDQNQNQNQVKGKGALSEARVSHPLPAPTDTTCMFRPPRPRTGLFPAHWPTTIPAISSFPPWGGIDWIPLREKEKLVNVHERRIKDVISSNII